MITIPRKPVTLLPHGFYLFHSKCFTILHAHAAIAFRCGVCATFANDFPTAVPPGCLAMIGLVIWQMKSMTHYSRIRRNLRALSCVHTAYDTRLKLKICFENPAKRERPFQLALFAPFMSIFFILYAFFILTHWCLHFNLFDSINTFSIQFQFKIDAVINQIANSIACTVHLRRNMHSK